jgi:hypothetical protein
MMVLFLINLRANHDGDFSTQTWGLSTRKSVSRCGKSYNMYQDSTLLKKKKGGKENIFSFSEFDDLPGGVVMSSTRLRDHETKVLVRSLG